MANASIQPIYERLNGVSDYHPLNAETFSDWAMESGDLITVVRDGKEYNVPVQTSRLVWKGKQSISIESTGSKKRKAVAKMSARKYGSGGSAVRANSNIYYELTDENGIVKGTITATANELRTEFHEEEEGLQTQITQNATAISLEATRATEAEGVLSGRITVAADAITQEVTRASEAEGTLSGRITTTADAITQEVTRATEAEGTLSGRITTNANKVAIVVEEKDGQNVVKTASIVTAINNSESSIRLDADKVYIGNKKSTTVINGKIDADDITASYIKGKVSDIDQVLVQSLLCQGAMVFGMGGSLSIQGSSCTFSSGSGTSTTTIHPSSFIKDIQVVANGSTGYKLQYKTAFATETGWTDAGTFSRATSLSGAWGGTSGTTYTVTASPQGNTISTTAYLAIEGTANPNAKVYAKIYKDNPNVPTNQLTSTEMTLEENVSGKYVALKVSGVTDPKGKVSTASTYNAGWDYGLTRRSRSTRDATSQELTVKTLDYDQRWTIVDTYTASNGTTSEVKYTVASKSDRYDDGRNAVTLNNPYWDTVSTLTASRTVTVSTNGRPTQLSKSKTVHLTVGSWSGGSIPIYIRDGSTSGTAVAQNSVSMPAVSSTTWTNTSGDTWRADLSIGGATRSSSTKDFSGIRSAGYTTGAQTAFVSGSNSITSNGTYIYKGMYTDLNGDDQESGNNLSVSVNVVTAASIDNITGTEVGNVYYDTGDSVDITASGTNVSSLSRKVTVIVGNWRTSTPNQGQCAINVYLGQYGNANDTRIIRKWLSMPASATWNWTSQTASTWTVSCTVNGRTYTSTHSKT